MDEIEVDMGDFGSIINDILNTVKTRVPNIDRIKIAKEMYNKLKYLLDDNGIEYTLNGYVDELFQTKYTITFNVNLFCIMNDKFKIFRDIINNVDDILIHPRTDDTVCVSFSIFNIFNEYKQE